MECEAYSTGSVLRHRRQRRPRHQLHATRDSGSAASVLRYQSSAIGGNAASVLGLTGDGRAALFSYSRHAVEPRGYVDFIHLESQATGIDSPAALQSWSEEMLAAIPA